MAFLLDPLRIFLNYKLQLFQHLDDIRHLLLLSVCLFELLCLCQKFWSQKPNSVDDFVNFYSVYRYEHNLDCGDIVDHLDRGSPSANGRLIDSGNKFFQPLVRRWNVCIHFLYVEHSTSSKTISRCVFITFSLQNLTWLYQGIPCQCTN